MSIAYPFVDRKRFRTKHINNTRQLIFGTEQYKCSINSIFVINTTDKIIKISVYVLEEVSPGVTDEFFIANQQEIPPRGRTEFLPDSNLTLYPGELLYAFSDFSANLFNVNVDYIEFSEIGVTPP